MSSLLKIQILVLTPLVLSKEFFGNLHSNILPFMLTIFLVKEVSLLKSRIKLIKINFKIILKYNSNFKDYNKYIKQLNKIKYNNNISKDLSDSLKFHFPPKFTIPNYLTVTD